MHRVVVTGIGAVTPFGNTFHGSWEEAKQGRSGIRPIKRFDTSDIPWKFAGELEGYEPREHLTPKEVLRLDPFVRYALSAAVMAIDDAGLITINAPGCLSSGGVIVGSSRGGIGTVEQALTAPRKKGGRRFSPYLMPATTISMAPSFVAQRLGIEGHCLGISNACASGANAIGEAFRLLQSGFPGPVIAGGSEAPVCRFCIEGYGVSGVLSKRWDPSASRPFDRERDGFVIAEGACMLVMERLENALRRGARIYGEIAGYASTADAFHQTKPDRRGEAKAIETALAGAGIKPPEVDYISSHGTSTRLGDRVEAEAIGSVFGKRASSIPVSAVKSLTGHMLAASGALEAAFTLMSIREGVIPPTINVSERDPSCNLNVITGKTDIAIKTAVSNSFGFGGVNAVLILRSLSS